MTTRRVLGTRPLQGQYTFHILNTKHSRSFIWVPCPNFNLTGSVHLFCFLFVKTLQKTIKGLRFLHGSKTVYLWAQCGSQLFPFVNSRESRHPRLLRFAQSGRHNAKENRL